MPDGRVLRGVVIAACYASGLAVIGHVWVLFWACASLVILAVPAGKLIGIMAGAGGVERGPSTRAIVTGRDAAVDPGVRLG
jgi:hypothetical protein